MPLEINEIAIRMRIGEEPERPLQAQRQGGSQRGEGGCGDVDREEIVEDCVRRAVAILRTLAER